MVFRYSVFIMLATTCIAFAKKASLSGVPGMLPFVDFEQRIDRKAKGKSIESKVGREVGQLRKGKSTKANGNDGNGFEPGHVKVYEFDGTDWNQLGADIDGEDANDNLGPSMPLSNNGNVVAVGCTGCDGNGVDLGNVKVYEFDGTDWNPLVGADIDGEDAHGNSGSSVSLSKNGDIVVIGAKNSDGKRLLSGRVKVYGFDGTAWNQLGADIYGEDTYDISGW